MLFLIGCPPPLPSDASLALDGVQAIVGAEPGGRAGMSVDFAGDLNGDGGNALLIGAPYVDGVGVAWLLSAPSPGAVSLSDSAIALRGTHAGDAAGFAVAGAGDTDGDGLDDVLVGAWGEDSTGTDAGIAWLIRGPITADGSLDSLGQSWPGEYSYDNAGFSVAGAGDTDGDGLDDVLIGAPFHDDGGSRSGTVFLHTASGTARLSGARAADELGHSVSTAGDINGDGLADIIVGAWQALHGRQRTGAAYLWLGPVSGTLDAWTADHILTGTQLGERAGADVAALGDVNGDGRDDVGVGSMTGHAWLLYGRAEEGRQRLDPDREIAGQEDALVGAVLSPAGDLDGDGRAEVLIGAPSWDLPEDNAGGFAVYYGSDDSTETLTRRWWSMAGAGALAGIALAGGQDLNGDGSPEVLIGGPGGGVDREGTLWLLTEAAW